MKETTMTREQLASLPEFQILETIAHSKRHYGKTLEIQQALLDLLGALPSERRSAVQVQLGLERHAFPQWVDAVADEVSE